LPEPLKYAIQNDSAKDVHRLLTGPRPIPIDIRNEASESSLMVACSHGAVESVNAILDIGISDLEATDAIGWTALHHAAKNGSLEILHKLLEKGANVGATTNKNETCLHLVAKEGHTRAVDYLVKMKCPLNAQTSGFRKDTALHLALYTNHEETALRLLGYSNCDVRLSIANGDTALHIAAENDQLCAAKELITLNADVNAPDGKSICYLHLTKIYDDIFYYFIIFLQFFS